MHCPLLYKRRGQGKRLSDEFGYMRTFIFYLYGSILAASYLRYNLKDISGWGYGTPAIRAIF